MPAASPALPALVWSASIEAVAQTWANGCNYGHNPGRGFVGENIFASTSPYGARAVVGQWAAEVANYNYATNTCTPGQVCGHYTQLVWRNTTSVGCAVRQCTTGSPFSGWSGPWYFVVCDYSPPGNFNNQWPY